MRRTVFLLLVFICTRNNQLNAQSCFNVAAGNDTLVSCSQTCFDLKAKVPDIKTTDTYSVIPIPYNPLPFISPTGTELTLLYQDDIFSETINMPFTFCFYGQNYNKLSVGSNGVITFDIATNAGFGESYAMAAGNNIFYAGGVPNLPTVFYAPRASIFLAYYDMDPRQDFSPRDRKIEWRLEGNAPCRKMVISYYKVDNYHGETPGTGTCINNLCTMQVVLYEGTGLIDVFYEYKPACTGYQGGLAIAGLQNWDQNKAVTLPGKNGTLWVADHEAYRYVPSGTGSLLNRVELYKNGSLVSTGTTTPLGNGQLDVFFPGICQPEPSADYVVKAFYQKCDNPLIETEGSDTIKVTKTPLVIANTVTNVLCKNGNGTITVTSPVGPNIEYSIDGGSVWQTSNIFTRPAGTYNVLIRSASGNCSGNFTATIAEPPLLNITATGSTATCAGNDGSITVTATGGTTAYSFSIDGGSTFQNNGSFSVLPGTYNNIIVKDANGCTATSGTVVNFTDQMFLSAGNDTTVCEGGTVTLQPLTNTQTTDFLWSPATYLNSSTVKNPVATPADTVHYTLTAKWGICQRTDDIIIRVLHKPVVAAGNDTIICYSEKAFLQGTISNTSGPINYAWAPAGKVANAAALATTTLTSSTQLFTLTASDNYGCHFTVTDDVQVSVRPPVIAYAGNDTIAVLGMPHQLFGSGGTSYLWSPANNLDNPFSPTPKATLYNDTYFTLTVKNDIGCSAWDDVFIKVYKGPTYYIPNAFSPNGDRLNDIFRPIPVGIIFTDYFSIFNRYGEMVFTTNGWLKGWDGMYKRKNAEAGVYTWMIKGKDKDGKTVEMKGTVILMR